MSTMGHLKEKTWLVHAAKKGSLSNLTDRVIDEANLFKSECALLAAASSLKSTNAQFLNLQQTNKLVLETNQT